MTQLILASGSKYRHQRLHDANIQFSYQSPDIDETAFVEEQAEALAKRLAKLKVEKVVCDLGLINNEGQDKNEHAIVIGSDQVAEVIIDNRPTLLGKPGCHDNAFKQLSQCSGKTVTFYTSLYAHHTATKKSVLYIDKVNVAFRKLSDHTINQYLAIDKPFDCAGSFKMEKAGIALFESIQCDDPNALIGLPMISLTNALEKLGESIFTFMPPER